MFKGKTYEVRILKFFLIIPYIKKIYIDADSTDEVIDKFDKSDGFMLSIKLYSYIFNGEKRYF